ncbi:Fic family protein [Saxibacter everestensis]|uniref:Fic family protein n=1 Tax=Saxibacter everestensis TaxID=2909229 RepID=A0ABY8QVK2_9MICO|nr:Fic family protein [Brevibacteriaceae bacterium ZFBP1038]
MLNDRTAASWPAVGWESQPWQIPDAGAISRTRRRKHLGDYSAAIAPPIADQDPRLPTELLAESEDAAAQIVRFDEYSSARLGNHGEEIAPMAAVLLRSESAASSQIENLTVGARQLALAELGERSSRNASIVASNVRAMQAANELSEKIDESSILEMHRALLAGTQPDTAGQFRQQQVWIGGTGVGPHQAMFVPPHHSRVRDSIRDLVGFIAREDIPVLPQTAIAHAQFETIHPFTDGNGRTGRALMQAMLRQKELTQRVTVPVSAGLLTETDQYFDALMRFREGDPKPIVSCTNDAVFASIANGRLLVDELADIRAILRTRITARRDAAVWRLGDAVITQPVINTSWVASHLGVSWVAAQRAITQLADAGILVATSKQARNRTWECREVLQALDDFSARAGRRIRV